jgi:hypothetical protein
MLRLWWGVCLVEDAPQLILQDRRVNQPGLALPEVFEFAHQIEDATQRDLVECLDPRQPLFDVLRVEDDCRRNPADDRLKERIPIALRLQDRPQHQREMLLAVLLRDCLQRVERLERNGWGLHRHKQAVGCPGCGARLDVLALKSGKAAEKQTSPKINFREIFRVVRFSTFATISRR